MPYKDPQKRKEFYKKYYLEHRGEILLNISKRYQDNKEEIKEYSKERYKQNRDRMLELQKEYRTKNKEAYRAGIDKRMKENKEEYKIWKKEWTKEYSKKNRAAIYARDVKRRELKRDSIDATTDIKKIKQFYVLAEKLTTQTGIKYVVDHIIPIIKG